MKKLGFGMMRMPQLNKDDVTSIDLDQVCKMVDVFLQKGFTYFDTAYMYHKGMSESTFKKTVSDKYPREKYVVATKLPVMMMHRQADNERIFSEQLAKCGVSYFDYYLLHCLNRLNNIKAKRLGSFEFVIEKKKEGKIKNIGFSWHDSAEKLEQILKAHPEMDFVQLQINYLDWDNFIIQSRKNYEMCLKYGKKIIIMEPVKGGKLAQVPYAAKALFEGYSAESSAASWAIRFCAGLDNVFMVLSGMSDIAQLEDNTSYMQNFVPINEQEKIIIKEVVEIMKSKFDIPCTACNYCVDGCPKKIPVPYFFKLLNAQKQFGERSNSSAYYNNYIADKGVKASDCIGCKKCEKACPQHINITRLLKKVEKEFEK